MSVTKFQMTFMVREENVEEDSTRRVAVGSIELEQLILSTIKKEYGQYVIINEIDYESDSRIIGIDNRARLEDLATVDEVDFSEIVEDFREEKKCNTQASKI